MKKSIGQFFYRLGCRLKGVPATTHETMPTESLGAPYGDAIDEFLLRPSSDFPNAEEHMVLLRRAAAVLVDPLVSSRDLAHLSSQITDFLIAAGQPCVATRGSACRP